MTERLLQFIWQFQYFNKAKLKTAQGERLTVHSAGKLNTHQGPDFTDAKVSIGETIWAGNIEIHIRSSDWHRHNHSSDKNYSNIILHVVWENDADIYYENGSIVPALEIQDLVPKILLDRYTQLMMNEAFVPCETYLPAISEMKWISWKERLAVERLQRKSGEVLQLLAEAGSHWEEVFWWMLARNFGIKVNAGIFEAIAKTLPVNVLSKHKNQIHQLEGLLLGQAGLLDESFEEDYPNVLKREYLFYSKKYGLKQTLVKPFFLRMRPAAFPTIRLAQLAMLIKQSSHLFSKVKETSSVEAVIELLNVTANDYWHYHYLFDQPGNFQPKQLGRQMVENIIINTVIPILFAYGIYNNNDSYKDKALQWLSALAAEKNSITNKWKAHEVSNSNALESQALIELKNNYCNERKCLQCAVGNSILRERR